MEYKSDSETNHNGSTRKNLEELGKKTQEFKNLGSVEMV